MNKVPAILLGTGIVIQFAAFMGEHADEVPIVLRVIAPSYFNAKAALNALEETGSLGRTNKGFLILEPILMEHAYEINHTTQKERPDLGIIRIEHIDTMYAEHALRGGVTSFTSDDLTYTVGEIALTGDSLEIGQQPVAFYYHTQMLKERVEDLKEPNLLIFCVTLFLIGTAVDVLAFVVEQKESEKAKNVDCQNSLPSIYPKTMQE